MGYGDDLLITKLASKIKKKYPDRQIIIGSSNKKTASHSIIFDNNPNIADCRNLKKNIPIHLINYNPSNRPYIDYIKSTNTKYVWKKFKPEPGQIFFSQKEKLDAKKIISQAIDYWKKKSAKRYKKIIFIETSSTKIHDNQFGIKQQNKDWGYDNWEKLIEIINQDYLLIHSVHGESKKLPDIFTPPNMNFRLACAVLNESDFYVGPEGGFGHAAAALNKKAVLYFGGWISPEVIGYDFHENVYYENKLSPCGEYKNLCTHCEKARKKISVEVFLKHIDKVASN